MDVQFLGLKLFATLNQWVGAIFTLLAVLLLLLYWSFYRRRTKVDRSLNKTITRLGKYTIRNAMLPDDGEGIVFIDHIVLMPGGIFIFYLMNMPGNIFGAMRMDKWTQMVGNKSFHFINPLYELGEAMRVMRYHLPNIRVDGKIVFSNSTQFPKGKPEKVCLVSALENEMDSMYAPIDDLELKDAWDKLKKLINHTSSETFVQPRITRFDRI